MPSLFLYIAHKQIFRIDGVEIPSSGTGVMQTCMSDWRGRRAKPKKECIDIRNQTLLMILEMNPYEDSNEKAWGRGAYAA